MSDELTRGELEDLELQVDVAMDRAASWKNIAEARAAEIKRLREALRPFASAAEQISPGAGDDCKVYSGGLTAGHYRRARAALEDR